MSSDLSGFDTRYVDASRPSTGMGNRYRTHSATNATSANSAASANSTGTGTGPAARDTRGSLHREFVSTHLSAAAVDEEEAEEELIDTITADLLSSRDRNRSAGGNHISTTGRDNSHLYMNTTLNRQSNNNSNTSALRPGNNNTHSRGVASHPDDWDLNYSTPPRTASSTPHSSAGGVRNTSSGSPASARSVSVGSPRGVRGSVRDTQGTATPSSTSSSGVYSERSEHDSDSTDADALETVFQNDFFNRFFPFLSRKGSTFDSEHGSGNKKNR